MKTVALSRGLLLALLTWGLLVGGCAAPGTQPNDDEVFVVEPGRDIVLGKADSGDGEMRVEVKVMLPAWQIEEARDRFGLKKSRAQKRDVYYYDTPDLDVYHSGLVLRARKKIDAPDDSTVKLRPVDPDDVDAAWWDEPGFKCEEDRTRHKVSTSCSLTVEQDRGEIDDVADGDRAIIKLYSREQEDFFALRGAALSWDDLRPIGPIDAWVWKVKSSKLDLKLTFELWEIDHAIELLEVSTKVDFDEADAAQARLFDYLEARGFDTSYALTKTKAALSYYSGQTL